MMTSIDHEMRIERIQAKETLQRVGDDLERLYADLAGNASDALDAQRRIAHLLGLLGRNLPASETRHDD